ncbi:glycosyltransferase family 39 protein [Hyphomicrobium sp.]|uniref:glycosyltransferase family 39 protein n=1 Tax=Hyphomicrobium sp. TaxID=82 RepID=UPI001DBE6AAB|nr:glycosyltransferase family 39 protein [Hyphomicrobium sp.]MBY0562409.1 glycosyltransferase family 39 protein [Hyphomicrobium sp.]
MTASLTTITRAAPEPAHSEPALSKPPLDSRTAISILLAAVLALTAIRLGLAGAIGLVDDEAYYRIWSLGFSLSYLDHPPMVAWIIGAGRALAGDTYLGIRLLAPLIVAAGAAILWRTAYLLYGPEIARRAVWIMLAMPLLAVGGIIVTPDLPSVLTAGLVVWALAELDRSQNAKWWLAIGLFAGLGFLSKYTNLFLGGTILVWLVAGPDNRKWFRAPELWIGGIIAAAVASPVFIWNAQHGWASFTKQFGRVGHSGSGGLNYLLEFVGAFLALASPVIAVLAIWGLVRVTRSAVVSRGRSRPDVLLAAAVLPMLVYFTAHALHDRVQGNWPAPLYPSLAICGALALDAVSPKWRRTTFLSALGLGLVMTAGIYAHALHPLVAVAKDPTEQMRGWPAFADAIEAKRRETGAGWVATSSYATTGQMAMGLRGRSEVAQLDQRIRYEFLPPLPASVLAKPALYVELERRLDLPLMREKFRKIEPLGTLTRNNGSPNGATYVVYLLSDPPAPPL